MSVHRRFVVQLVSPTFQLHSRGYTGQISSWLLTNGPNTLRVPSRTYASRSKSRKAKDQDDEDDDISPSGTHAPPIQNNSKVVRKGSVVVQNLIPGSQQIFSGDDRVEYEKAKSKMNTAVDWMRREFATMEMRASGRVTPDVLSPVRVQLPSAKEAVKLDAVSTVGVRDGNTLIVTVFEEKNLKHVERAIYSAQLPGLAPQKVDVRTLKIPLPKPTVEARAAFATTASKQAEDTRVQLRKVEATAVKKGKYEKFSRELEEYRKLLDSSIKNVDKLLADTRKNLGVK